MKTDLIHRPDPLEPRLYNNIIVVRIVKNINNKQRKSQQYSNYCNYSQLLLTLWNEGRSNSHHTYVTQLLQKLSVHLPPRSIPIILPQRAIIMRILGVVIITQGNLPYFIIVTHYLDDLMRVFQPLDTEEKEINSKGMEDIGRE